MQVAFILGEIGEEAIPGVRVGVQSGTPVPWESGSHYRRQPTWKVVPDSMKEWEPAILAGSALA